MVCRFRADIPLLRLAVSLLRCCGVRLAFLRLPLALVSIPSSLARSLVRSEYCFARERTRLLSTDVPSCSRPWSTLRPVIKQPRGRQIESVEETRERRRRGDGQPAATMVSIVKGLSWRVRVPPNLKQSNEEGNAGIAEGGL